MKQSDLRSFGLVLSFIILLSPSAALAQSGQLPGVTLQNTELRTLKSRFVEQEYKLQIYLPPGSADASKSFPVLYLLDGDKSFGMARDIVDWLIFSREIPQLIIVGIAYDEGSKAWWDKRSRDYTPWKDRTKIWGDWPLAGGADNFKKFLQEELIPFIDSNYRTVKNDRAIAGLSFGGLFAAYVLFTEPSMFQKYIMSGASLIWDDYHLFKLEEEFSRKNKSLPVSVYTAIGELDAKNIIKPWTDFNAILEKRQYEGLKLSAETIKGETHISAWPASFTRGLKAVYANPIVLEPKQKVKSDLPSDTLAYSLPQMDKVTVRHEIYHYAGDKPLTMDIYYPPVMGKEEKSPAVIFVMGYADSSPVTKGPLKDLAQIISWGRLTAASGLIAVTYQTERPDDLEALVAYIRKRAADLRIDPGRIGLWSCSGNCLTAVSFAMNESLGNLKFAVFYYGLMLTPDNWLRKEINALCAPRGCYAAELKDVVQLRSDLPLLVVRAGRDNIPYVNDSIDHFIDAARIKGVPLTRIDFENGVHAFDAQQKSEPRAGEIVKQTLEFMKKNLLGK